MSNNKNKFFEVITISSVKARNMAEARKAAAARTRVPGTEVLARSTSTERLYAQDALALARTLESN